MNPDRSELVIAFVGAVGVDLLMVENKVKAQLEEFGYTVECIRVSTDVIPLLDPSVNEGSNLCQFDRIDRLMTAGTNAREKKTDILALGIAKCIREKREKGASAKVAYLIRSLKHPDEVRKLRELYPRGFYLFGVYAPGEVRKNNLIHQKCMNPEQADRLMKRDAKESSKHGQQVVDTFHLSDFFVGWSKEEKRIQEAIVRFVDIIFGHPYRTPTFGEYAMHLAFTSSLRSADLSRQVGAVIARDGEILSLGANDCPKFGGGLYWPEYDDLSKSIVDLEKGRDWKRGGDSNREEQIILAERIFDKCKASIPSGSHDALMSALRSRILVL